MEKIVLSKEQLKNFLVVYHGLSKTVFEGSEGIEKFVKRVGCIQYDPLNIVGRNPDLVLQSRINNYQKEMLTDLLYNKRSLIDATDKELAIYSTEDWPYFKRRRIRHETTVKETLAYRDALEALDYNEIVKKHILENGPSVPAQLNLGKLKKGSWGHGNLSSATMDYLYKIGELGVKEKRNTQKVYDLIERLIPVDILNHPDPFKNDEEYIMWYTKRRLGGIGIFWDKNGDGWMGSLTSKVKPRKENLRKLVENKELILIEVEGFKENFYIRNEDLSILESIDSGVDNKITFIGPLDNFIWDRKYIKAIFDFEYTWEVYKPKDQRKYGYYVLPVLYGNKFIARFEPELHHKGEPLVIKNWWWESGVIIDDELKVAINKAFEQFAYYLNASEVIHNIF